MIYVNDRFVEMTGYPREESIGRNCRFLQGEGTDGEAVAELRRAIDATEPTTVELKNYRRDGEPFWNRVSISPLFGGDDGVNYWVGFQRDITAYKRREKELQRQNSRLERFASIVSHDLRSPLSVAMGRVELVNAELEDENLEAAMDALDRMGEIVDDTLTLARQGDTVGELRTVSLSEVVPECWRTTDTGEASVELETDAEFRADPDRLPNLLENLFTNAVTHGGGGVTVRVGAMEGGFYVEDDGAGIPEDERGAVFDPGHTTAEAGTGFGLTIVKEIAEAHGWTVSVGESAEGGARFEITGVSEV
jgi:PAS domain S-box-containing protein